MMGNRGGALHNDQREIVRSFKDRRWITCVLEFKGRRRAVMSPGRYTELFFLDEAVAFAAGHRPCAECRRERYNAFRQSWVLSHAAGGPPRASEMDAELHRHRVDRQGWKVTYLAKLDSLPNGTFLDRDGSPWLAWDDALVQWTPAGYTKKDAKPNGLTVTVLTPRPIVDCFRYGYEPETHDSIRVFAQG